MYKLNRAGGEGWLLYCKNNLMSLFVIAYKKKKTYFSTVQLFVNKITNIIDMKKTVEITRRYVSCTDNEDVRTQSEINTVIIIIFHLRSRST